MNRRNLETYDIRARTDRLIAAVMYAACDAILLFTGAGEVMWGQIQSYLATWSV